MKNKTKWISKAAMTLGVLTMLGSAGMGAAVPMVYAAQDISGNPVSDDDSARKLTIWKYEINSTAELGERGDGINPDPSKAPDLAGKKMMQDVNFEIIKIKAKGTAELTDPLTQTEGVDWEVDTDNPYSKKGKTDSDGKLVFEVSEDLDADKKKLADGIYIVREIPDASGKYTYTKPADPTAVPPTAAVTGLEVSKPMDPFFVYLPQTKRDDTGSLIYDVHVYPKNIVTDTELDKTIEGGKGYSIKAGQDFEWAATTKLPSGLYSEITKEMTITNWLDPADNTKKDLVIDSTMLPYDLHANYFKVTDNLNEKLLLKDIVVQVLDKDGTTWKNLTIGSDYEVQLNGAAVAAHPVTNMTPGAAKEVIVNLKEAGMKKVTVDEDTHIRILYQTTVEQDFNGRISNVYKVDYLLPGQDPFQGTSDEPEYFNGGFDIKKVKTDGTTILDGAEFHIATTKKNAVEGRFLASDGKSYKKDTDKYGPADTLPTTPVKVTFLKATSGEDPAKPGIAEFDGLELDWFTDTNGNNEQDPEIATEATWSHDKIQREYWVVETKAPAGYELLRDPQSVIVKLGTPTTVPPVPGTDDDAQVEVTVKNNPKTKLPFTGGAGTTLMIVVALGAITIGTATISIERKRRQV